MKIICQKCNKNGGCKKTSAHYDDSPLKEITPVGENVWRKVRCNVCNYVSDEYYGIVEKSQYNLLNQIDYLRKLNQVDETKDILDLINKESAGAIQ